MTRTARFDLAAVLLLGGATVAMAQNGPPTGRGYPPAGVNPNLYGYHHHRYYHRHYYAYHPYYRHRYYHRYY